MSPRQIAFLANHLRGAWNAQELRHFEGKPFDADIPAMPFYGATIDEQERLQATEETMCASRSADGRLRLRGPAMLRPEHSMWRSRSELPPRRAGAFTVDDEDGGANDIEGANDVNDANDTDNRVQRCRTPQLRRAMEGDLARPASLLHEKTNDADQQSHDTTAGLLVMPAKKRRHTDALSFLNPVSSAITKEGITQSDTMATSWPYATHPPVSESPGTISKPDISGGGGSVLSDSTSSDSDSSIDGTTVLHLLRKLPVNGVGSDTVTSPEPSENGDDTYARADAGSPTPKLTPAREGLRRIPDVSSLHLASTDSAGIPQSSATPYSVLGHALGPIPGTMHSFSFQSIHRRPHHQYHQDVHHQHPHQLPHTAYTPHGHTRKLSQAKAHVASQQRKYRSYRYGTPEMPRGNANLPHLPPSALNPRQTTPGHAKHLPRAEKLPLTGYELLASQLSLHSSHIFKFRRGSLGATSATSSHSVRSANGGVGTTCDRPSTSGETAAGMRDAMFASGTGIGDGTPILIKPLYRKFEALNHRILLHLQDELSELEEQLHRLDTADTQTRRLQNSILPASRRAGVLAGGELQWHKTDILGKIGYKLGQYNHVLSSFTETQRLASPTLSDIGDYRAYLDTQQPIAEIETRFLDASDDLVTLASHNRGKPSLSGLRSPSESSSERSDASLSGAYLQTLGSHAAADHPTTCSPLPFGNLPNALSRSSPTPLVPASAHTSPLSHSATLATLGKTGEQEQFCSSEHGGRSNHSCSSRCGCDTMSTKVTPMDDPLHLAIAMAVAVLVPVLAFAVIPTFAGRMAIAALVALTVYGTQVQAGTNPVVTGQTHQRGSLLACACVYGAVMAAVACTCA